MKERKEGRKNYCIEEGGEGENEVKLWVCEGRRDQCLWEVEREGGRGRTNVNNSE